MILFINGFVPQQWLPVELKRDAAGYAGAAAAYVGYTQFLANMSPFNMEQQMQMAEQMRLGILNDLRNLIGNSYTSEKNTRNPYLPARNITPYNPVYQGDPYDYWGGLKTICTNLLGDDEMGFINASSENTSTGDIRYQDGRRKGENLVAEWEVYDRDSRARALINRHNSGGKLSSAEMAELARRFPQYTRNMTMGESQMIGNNPLGELMFGTVGNTLNRYMTGSINSALHFKPAEKLTIVAHSQGCAFAAGLASVLARHQQYRSRLNAIFYLAPHDPAGFEHPAGIPGYQSSCKSDWVVSIGSGPPHVKHDSMLRGLANRFRGVEMAFLKGPANYVIIKNVPPQNYLENTTWTQDEMNRHGAVIYEDEMRHLIYAHNSSGNFTNFSRYLQMRRREGRGFQGN